MRDSEDGEQVKTLLVVVDDDAFRNRLMRAMGKRGYEMTAVATVGEAQQVAPSL